MALKWSKLNLCNMATQRKPITHTIDASGKVLGRLASEIAPLLMGKKNADFTPNIDTKDVVEVKNAARMILTGNKLEQKEYYHHSMYPNGLKTLQLKTLWKKDPADALRRSVSRMLPKNRMRDLRLKRLIITN